MTQICDYNQYDYKKKFWEESNRTYEDLCEKQTLTRLIKKIPHSTNSILDVGCGFGRLFSTYEPFASSFYLLDFSKQLLDQAKKEIQTTKTTHFIEASFFNMPIGSESIDLIISLRTLHHVASLSNFFKEMNRSLVPGGYFILEIPNQRHIVNIIKYILKKSPNNPFSKTPIKLGSCFYNYHPTLVLNTLQQTGFDICILKDTSFFRSTLLKTIFSPSLLATCDTLFQTLFSVLHLTPSIYVLCKKN